MPWRAVPYVVFMFQVGDGSMFSFLKLQLFKTEKSREAAKKMEHLVT